MFKKLIKLVCLVAVMAGLTFGVYKLTAPTIAEKEAANAFGPLYEVMPDAEDFALLYDYEDPDNSEYSDVAGTIKYIYGETNDIGYVVCFSTTEGYTGDPIDFTVAFSKDGKILATLIELYSDSKDFGADYPELFVGEDSTLANVDIVAGVTYSSSAFKNAIADGFEVLIINDAIGAGEKSDAQKLDELLPTVASGFANSAGILQVEDMVTDKVKASKALNGSGVAFVVEENGSSNLVVVNSNLSAAAYDVDGNAVTLSEETVNDCINAAGGVLEGVTEKELTKLGKLAGSDSFTPLDFTTHNSVIAAYSVNGGYAFITRPYHFNNEPVTYYFVLDANGAIKSVSADKFIIEAEYCGTCKLDEESYKAGFAGVTADTLTDDVTLVTGATFSTNAAKTATRDVFETYASMLEGE